MLGPASALRLITGPDLPLKFLACCNAPRPASSRIWFWGPSQKPYGVVHNYKWLCDFNPQSHWRYRISDLPSLSLPFICHLSQPFRQFRPSKKCQSMLVCSLVVERNRPGECNHPPPPHTDNQSEFSIMLLQILITHHNTIITVTVGSISVAATDI